MQTITTLLLSSLCAATLMTGCSGKDGEPGPAGSTGASGPAGPAGPAGQNLTGNLFGFVNAVDEDGSQQAKAGTTVTLEGATSQTATTDVNGRFEFAGVRSGTYNLAYSRQGYGTLRRFGLAHIGGDQPTFLNTFTFSQTGTTVASGVTATPNPSASSIVLNFTLSKPAPASTFRYAVLASASASATAANSVMVAAGSFGIGGTTATSLPANSIIHKSSFNNSGFASGTTVYLTVYGSTFNTISFTDPTTGRLIYPSLNATPSNTVAVVVPQ